MGDHNTASMHKTNGIRDNEVLEGVLISRARGKTFTSLILAKIDNDNNNEDPTDFGLVRLRFPSTVSSELEDNTAKELRSFCRRYFKIGDRLKIALSKSIREDDSNDRNDELARKTIRIVVDCPSEESAKEQVQILASRHWDSKRCQQFQDRWKAGREHPPKTRKRKLKPETSSCVDTNGHGTGRAKMSQAEHLANFLVDMIVYKLLRETQKSIEESPENLLASMPPSEAKEWRSKAIDYLNSGGGVCDVAGGSGHVSMALGLLGVQSTVIDPRERVGMLPGRERKVWKRALKKQQNQDERSMVCQPVVPFRTQRSWFGVAPDGVDLAFRHPDRETVSVCDQDSSLVQQASAIVALHPDEATGEAVRVAVAKKIPFMVVPCCVFARCFPLRKIPSTQQSVRTYPELVRYLQEQDSSIRKHQFPFAGRNTALWSIF